MLSDACLGVWKNSNVVELSDAIKVIEKCTNFYFGTEKLPPKF